MMMNEMREIEIGKGSQQAGVGFFTIFYYVFATLFSYYSLPYLLFSLLCGLRH